MQIKNISCTKLLLINLVGCCFWYLLQILDLLNSFITDYLVLGAGVVIVGTANYLYVKKSDLKQWKKLALSSILTVVVILIGYYAINLSTSSISEDAAYMKNIPNIESSKQ